VKHGDKVVMHWRKAAGIESDFPRYKYNGKWITSGLVTTFAEQAICSENRLTPIPADTDNDLAALLGCGLSTALGTVEEECREFGKSVLVLGCGGLGLSLLAALELVSPSRVCACDIHENKRKRVQINEAEFVNLSKERISGKFDLVLDTAGAPAAMEEALEHMAPSGRYVMIGQPRPGKPVCLNNARHMFDGEGKTIRATQGGGFRPDLDVPRYLLAAKNLFIHNLITHRVKLDDINVAIDLVQHGEAGRVMIDISKP
jgi:Zn-dependent alcohol dehydrogenase